MTYQSIDNLLRTNEALAQFNTTSKQLTQSQKAIARTILVLQGARNAWGDASKTINTLENQIRVFQGTLQNLKLTLGDTISGIFRPILIFINGLLIGINNIIRAIVPLKKATGNDNENPFAQMAEGAKEADKAVGLLGFDEFNVLEQGGESELAEDQAITEELEHQLALQQEQYEAIQARMEKMHNFAVEIGDIIGGWFVRAFEKNPEFTENLEEIFKSVFDVIKPFGGILGEITNALQPILEIVIALINPILGIVSGIAKLISWTMTFLDKSGILLAVITAIIGKMVFMNLVAKGNPIGAIITLVITLGTVVGTVVKKIAQNWDMLGQHLKDGARAIGNFFVNLGIGIADTFIKIVNVLIDMLNAILSPIDAIAEAFGGEVKIPHWEADVSQYYNAIPKFAQGGIPSVGSMFIAGEAGAELVGNIGGQTNVINMEQLSQAVYNGTLSAILQANQYVGDIDTKPNVVVTLDGREIFKSVQSQAKSQGLGFSKIK